MEYQIHKKFLPVDFFEKIKNLVMDQDFPWRKRDHMVTPSHDALYFTYCFYNSMKSCSELYEPYMIPILKQLRVDYNKLDDEQHAVAPIQIRANMLINALFKKSSWHRDYGFNCKTSLLYLNDCDGGTEIQINNKITFIKADANKMLIFDTPILHRAITSKNEPIRYVINFNYFTS